MKAHQEAWIRYREGRRRGGASRAAARGGGRDHRLRRRQRLLGAGVPVLGSGQRRPERGIDLAGESLLRAVLKEQRSEARAAAKIRTLLAAVTVYSTK